MVEARRESSAEADESAEESSAEESSAEESSAEAESAEAEEVRKAAGHQRSVRPTRCTYTPQHNTNNKNATKKPLRTDVILDRFRRPRVDKALFFK